MDPNAEVIINRASTLRGTLGARLREVATHRGDNRTRIKSLLSGGIPAGKSLDASKIEAAYVGYRTLFNRRLKQAPSVARRIATFAQTDNVLDRQLWLTKTPKMRRWYGDKTLHKLRGESHPIPTWLHEASVQVPKQDIINDRLGLYSSSIGGMGDAYSWALDDMVCAALCAGVAGTSLGTSYDGQNLIDTDHTALSVGGTAQSNKVTGALSATTYNSAINKLLSLLDENGNPINVAGQRMYLVHGPANREAARAFLQPDAVANGADNVDQGTAIPLCTPWLTARTTTVNGVSVTISGLEWFLIPEGSAAVIVHEKQMPDFMSVEEGEFTFRTGNYLYGIEAEFGFAYGLWQEIAGGPGV
jgi:phage major head subunit gpT-like protein